MKNIVKEKERWVIVIYYYWLKKYIQLIIWTRSKSRVGEKICFSELSSNAFFKNFGPLSNTFFSKIPDPKMSKFGRISLPIPLSVSITNYQEIASLTVSLIGNKIFKVIFKYHKNRRNLVFAHYFMGSLLPWSDFWTLIN